MSNNRDNKFFYSSTGSRIMNNYEMKFTKIVLSSASCLPIFIFITVQYYAQMNNFRFTDSQ